MLTKHNKKVDNNISTCGIIKKCYDNAFMNKVLD